MLTSRLILLNWQISCT